MGAFTNKSDISVISVVTTLLTSSSALKQVDTQLIGPKLNIVQSI